MTPKSIQVMNLPNWLSVARVCAVPVLILLMIFGGGGETASITASMLFVAAVLTDFLDGFLARRWKLETNLGRFLDPLADKLINTGAFIMLIPLGRAPAWMVFMIIGRELAVTGLRGMAANEGLVISASEWGKAKAVTQYIAIGMLLWHYPIFKQDTHFWGMVFLWVCLILTYWSGVDYFMKFYKVFVSPKNPQKDA